MDTSEIIALALCGSVITILFFSTLIKQSRRLSAWHQTARNLDFRQLNEVPPELDYRLERFRSSENKSKSIIAPWVLERNDGRLYLFGTKSSGNTQSQYPSLIMAIVSSNLALPTFTFLPLAEGGLKGIARKWVERTMENRNPSGMQPIEITDHAGFDERFLVLSHDEGAVQAFLNPSRLSQLNDIQGRFHIETSGDTFLYYNFNIAKRKGKDPQDLRTLCDQAWRILSILSRDGWD